MSDEPTPEDDGLRTVEVEHDGFIWPSRSGVAWTNQTHGLACLHPEIEGVFIPMSVPDEIQNLTLNLGAIHSLADLGPEFLDKIDATFAECRRPFRVCRDHLGPGWEDGSGEAWLWVEVTDDAGSLFAFAGEKGVLVWTNSD